LIIISKTVMVRNTLSLDYIMRELTALGSILGVYQMKGGVIMGSPNRLGIVILLVGVVVALVGAFADEIGVGAAGSGFGWAQLPATILGCIGIIAGIYLAGLNAVYVVAIGVLMVISLLVIDKAGLGGPGFGTAHVIGLLTGLGVAFVGGYLMMSKKTY
jgi:hypothetical protein